VVAQTRSLVVITYRPEYLGPLTRIAGGQTVALAPLDDAQIAALITELVGADPSVAGSPSRSPSGRRVTRFSPRRSCGISPTAAYSAVVAALMCARVALPKLGCRRRCRLRSLLASIGSVRGRNARSTLPQ
ncbi:MAG: hypothetical protein WAN71_27600, partial [Mycobacterium sp.]|uniref:hypothetical protein n=1 Tax=Mycobacterium sp. TaxID=1785 RepID=UPI003BAE848B